MDFLVWQNYYGQNSNLLLAGVPAAATTAMGLLANPSYDQIDKNGDGVISIEEADQAFAPLKEMLGN